LPYAGNTVVDGLALELLHDVVSVVGAGCPDRLEVLRRGRVVRRVRERRTYARLAEEPVGELAVAGVEVPTTPR